MTQRVAAHSPAPVRRRTELIDRIKATRRLRAHLESTEAALLRLAFDDCAEVAGGLGSDQFDVELRSMLFELGIETNTSDRSLQRELDQAWTLFEHYRETARAWRAGDVSRQHVAVIVRCGYALVDEVIRAQYERLVLDYAREHSPGPTESYARRVAAELDPKVLATRQEKARRERGVRVTDLDDGMSLFIAELDSACAHAMYDRLSATARSISQQTSAGELDSFGRRVDVEEPRTFDAIRADALVDLVLAGQVPADSPQAAVNAIQPRVAITVPALALMGASDEPAMLDGVGPIPLDVARTLAAGAAVWLRVLTHPVSGAALSADTYRPTATLRRFIATRDQHCRAPGCRRPARECDYDHSTDWARGGKTAHDNLAALCPSHHTIKHRGWQLSQTAQGELEWRAPSGRRFTDRPDRVAKPWTGVTNEYAGHVTGFAEVRQRRMPRFVPAPSGDDGADPAPF